MNGELRQKLAQLEQEALELRRAMAELPLGEAVVALATYEQVVSEIQATHPSPDSWAREWRRELAKTEIAQQMYCCA